MYLSDVAPRVGVSHVAALPFSADLRWRFRLHLQAFALLCPLAAVALAPSDAQAACSPATGNNVTVSCTLATVNQGPGINTGYGDGTQNGLTLNVVAGPPPASVTGASIGIDVNNNNTINNFGTITTNGAAIGNVYGISGEGNNLTVVNSGTIGRFDIPGFVFDLAAIFAPGTGIVITNNPGATIQGQEGIQGAGTGTIVNSGLITGLTTFGGGAGIDFSANNTAMVTVTNNSTGVINGDAFGINANSAVVTNYGTISAPTSGSGGTGLNANTLILTNYSTGLITGEAFGVSGNQTPNLTITNFGTISSTGFAGVAIQGNTVDITNSGAITSAPASASTAISTNSGTITNNSGGTISGDSGIQAFGNTSIFNAGTITGFAGTAISFASGGNTLTLGPGSVINGTAQGFGADTFQLGGTGTDTFDASLFATQYSGYTTFNKIGSSTWTLTGTGGGQAWNINAGTLVAGHQSGGIIDALGTGDITMNGGTLRSAVTGTFTNNLIFSTNSSSVVSAAAGQTLTFGPNGGASFVTFADGSTATFGSTTDTGTIIFSSDFNNVSTTAAIVVAGGTLRDGDGVLGNATGTAGSTTVNAGATLDMNDQTDAIHNLFGAGTVITGTSAATTLFLLNGNNNGTFDTNLFAGVITGPGAVEIGPVSPAGGKTILTGTNLYTGGTFIQDTTILQLGNNTTTGSILGNVTFRPLGVNGPDPGMLIFDRSNTYQFDGTISGPGVVVQAGSGTTILTANNSYTGATNVNAGVLNVTGSIATSSLTTVNNGGALMGTGTVGNTNILSGGLLAPGNGTPGTSLNVSGSLAFQSGALYLVMVNPATSSFTHATGTATLNGATVQAVFANGSYVQKQYTIVNANGGVSGTFNPTVVNANLPANFKTSLSYDANHAFLDLTLNFVPPSAPNFGGGLNINQQNVANALVNFFNSNGSIPLVFGTLSPAGLTQATGELATGSQQTTFDAMSLFMSLLTDPFFDPNGGATSPGGPMAFANSDPSARLSQHERDAYAAMYTKAPPVVPFERRWNVWAAGFGGSQTTDGNAVVGSNTVTSRIFGGAAGADYRFSPNTLAGFALAGGGTNFSLDNALGTGRSDLFQAGAYLHHREGAAYINAALAYGWQDITTDRTVTIAGLDRLHAEFNANAWSGRVEGGYRFAMPWMVGITPYAAAQFVTFDLPAYAETALVGTNNFALAYGAKTVTDPRTEFGLRSDKSFAMGDSVLTLRGRLAWAHDYNNDRNIGATFQALPGASFVVNGAMQARDSALTTASAEVKWRGGWAAAATFEGEFSSVTRSYAGKAVVRYSW